MGIEKLKNRSGKSSAPKLTTLFQTAINKLKTNSSPTNTT
jgi:hypothetical protein